MRPTPERVLYAKAALNVPTRASNMRSSLDIPTHDAIRVHRAVERKEMAAKIRELRRRG